MQAWCMAHPYMTLFLATLLILVIGVILIVEVSVDSKGGAESIKHKEMSGDTD